MTHDKAGVTGVKNPAEGLSEVVSGIDYARNVTHDDIAQGTPLLEAEVSNFDVAGAVSGAIILVAILPFSGANDTGLLLPIERRFRRSRRSSLCRLICIRCWINTRNTVKDSNLK